MLVVLLFIISLIEAYIIFEKMEIAGWKVFIPFYSTFCFFEKMYGNGWKMFLLLIPFYNAFLSIRIVYDLASKFDKQLLFGIGMLFAPQIFIAILAFDSRNIFDPDIECKNTSAAIVTMIIEFIAVFALIAILYSAILSAGLMMYM